MYIPMVTENKDKSNGDIYINIIHENLLDYGPVKAINHILGVNNCSLQYWDKQQNILYKCM